jgi:threonine/homoserine/homoserine lactone efflux protein
VLHSDLITFVCVVAVLTVTPGPDMALVTRQSLRGGTRAATLTILGISLGLLFHATLSMLGLSALLLESATTFTIIKTIGAVYLTGLGIWALWVSRRDRRARSAQAAAVAAGDELQGAAQPEHVPAKISDRAAFAQGLLTNLLNPKIVLFYWTFLPQFIHRGDPYTLKLSLLAAFQIALGTAWISCYVWLLSRSRDALRRPRVRLALERFTGFALVSFGLRLATLARV